MNASPPDVSPQRPWLGLRSYTLATQAYFYGRDEQIRELYQRAELNPLTMLYGRSGLGKTSLLQAGLLPRLTVEGRNAVLIRLNIADDAPRLLDQLRTALTEQAGVPAGTGTLWELAHHRATREAIELARPVLVFDQFEEIFTLDRRQMQNDRRGELAAFMAELASFVENRPPEAVAVRCDDDRAYASAIDMRESALRVVIALREDYLHELERWKKLLPSLMRNRMELLELDGPSALRAVVGPGSKHKPTLVDAEVAADIVRFVAKREPGTDLAEIEAVPPLLSLLCAELNESRIAEHEATITHERVSKHSGDILHRFYDRCFAGMPGEVREVIEDLLIDNSGRYRESSSRETVVGELTDKDVADAAGIVDELIKRRLLATDLRDGAQRVELMHDLLVSLAAASRATTEARRAELAERRRQEAERLATRKQQEAERREQIERMKWRLLTVVSLLLVVAIGAAFSAYREGDKARNAQKQAQSANDEVGRALIQAARRAYGRYEERLSDPFDRTRYAYLAESLSYGDLDHARAAAALALQQMEPDFGGQSLVTDASRPVDAQFSEDSTRLLTRHGLGGARVWEVTTGRQLAQVDADSDEYPVALGRSGSLLARNRDHDVIITASDAPDTPIATLPLTFESPPTLAFGAGDRRLLTLSEGSALLWDFRAVPPTQVRLSTQKAIHSAQFDIAGTRIVTVETGGLARFWNGTTGAATGRNIALGEATGSAAMSADGRYLIALQRANTVSVWSMSSGKRLWQQSSTGLIRSAGFSHDGNRVAIDRFDGSSELRDTADGLLIGSGDSRFAALTTASATVIGTLPVHPAFSPDDILMAGLVDGMPALRTAARGEKVGTLGNRSDATFFHFAPDGTRVLMLGTGAVLHDIRSRAALCESLRHDRPVADAFESTGRDVIATTLDGIYRWNVSDHQVVGQFRATASGQTIEFPPGFRAVPLLVGTRQPRLGDFIAQRNRFNAAGKAWNLIAGNGDAWTRVAAARTATEVVVYDTATGNAVGNPIKTADPLVALQLDQSGARVLTLGIELASRQYVISVWQIREQSDPALLSHWHQPTPPRLGPDASRFATYDEKRDVSIWDSSSAMQPLMTTSLGRIVNLAFGPDSQSIAFALDDGTLVLQKIGADATVFRAALPGRAGRIHFDTRQPRIAVAIDNHVLILDSRTGAQMADLTHDYAVGAIDFANDGEAVVTAGASGLQIWSLDSKLPLTPILLGGRKVNAIRFTADSQRIIVSLDDGSARVCSANAKIKATSSAFATALGQIGGLAVGDNGRLHKPEAVDVLAQFSGKPGPPSYFERIVRWHYADRNARTIAPFSGTLLADYVDSEVAWAGDPDKRGRVSRKATRDVLMNVYFLDPHDAKVVSALKGLYAESAAESAAGGTATKTSDAQRSSTPAAATSAPAAPLPAAAH